MDKKGTENWQNEDLKRGWNVLNSLHISLGSAENWHLAPKSALFRHFDARHPLHTTAQTIELITNNIFKNRNKMAHILLLY